MTRSSQNLSYAGVRYSRGRIRVMSESEEKHELTAAERQAMLKSIYEEVGRNFRHFLSWRRLLFAGYFALIAGLSLALNSDDEIKQLEPILLPLFGIVLSCMFLMLDMRNRDLIRNASDAGADLEKELRIENIGYYSNYRSRHYAITHSKIVGGFYLLAILFFLFLLMH